MEGIPWEYPFAFKGQVWGMLDGEPCLKKCGEAQELYNGSSLKNNLATSGLEYGIKPDFTFFHVAIVQVK